MKSSLATKLSVALSPTLSHRERGLNVLCFLSPSLGEKAGCALCFFSLSLRERAEERGVRN